MIQLQIIKGAVSELQITKGYEDFVFSPTGKGAIGIAAIGAAAMEQLFNSTILAASSGGAEISMEYFTCLIDGVRVAGCFHKVGFTNGENVEFVVQASGDSFAAVAARSDKQRLIWMLPYHERGEVAHRRHNLRWTWILSLGGGACATLAMWFLLNFDGSEPLWIMPTFFFGITAICILVSAFARSFFMRYGYAATPIFAAFGFNNPEETDLYEIDRAARKKIKQATGTGAPLTDSWTFRY